MGSFMYRLAARLRAHHRNLTLGQSVVEFALVLPVFLLFFAAALDLGRVFYANITLNNAAREGAFQAAITPALYVENQPCDQATNRVVCRIQNETSGSMIAIAPTDIDVNCSVPGCADAPGSLVTVEVRGKFRLITPLLSVIFGGQELDLNSSAVAQIEYLPDPNTATPPPGPVAAFTGSPTTVAVGGTVRLQLRCFHRQPDRLHVGLRRGRPRRLDGPQPVARLHHVGDVHGVPDRQQPDRRRQRDQGRLHHGRQRRHADAWGHDHARPDTGLCLSAQRHRPEPDDRRRATSARQASTTSTSSAT